MPRQEPIGFDHILTIAAPAEKVIGAFFDPHALSVWWGVARAIANPIVLGAYTLEWPPSPGTDALLGTLGGTFHGIVMDFRPGRAFFVAEAYWIPPAGAPVGPMSLEVTCTPPSRVREVVKAARAALPRHSAPAADSPGRDRAQEIMAVHVVQRGYEESERWRRYYELLGASLPAALEKLKAYLEHGRGIWDLRAW